jgi:hypothetical protein
MTCGRSVIFSGYSVFFHQDITEIVLKYVAFNTADTQMTTMSASKIKLEENINGRNSTHDLPDSEPAHYVSKDIIWVV